MLNQDFKVFLISLKLATGSIQDLADVDPLS